MLLPVIIDEISHDTRVPRTFNITKGNENHLEYLRQRLHIETEDDVINILISHAASYTDEIIYQLFK